MNPGTSDLVIVALHNVFEKREDILAGFMHPQQELLVDEFRQAVEWFLEAGYQFITPRQIPKTRPNALYCILTFDDGYANNLLILPVLREYGVPVVINIVPEAIESGEAFWWDCVYRKGKKLGRSPRDIDTISLG
jgi:peptidoglycan/xylan/chitin deacetylase (PgdA/CDA1 family)